MIPLPADEVAWAAQLACILEVNAWKPGNVSRMHDFADCRFEEFLVSAVAIGPAFREAARSLVGKTILEAVRATRGLVGTNTNLGMAVALAPLAKAAGTGHPDGLRAAVVEVLEDLTVEDALMAYEAIRAAAPAGLGKVERCDVYGGDADVTLRGAMELAKDRDALASEYVTGFELTFDVGYATLLRLWEGGCRLSDCILQTFLTILARAPDSLIARKNGPAAAERVSGLAQGVLKDGGVFSENGLEELKKLDLALRDERHRLNPGTTADLVAAAIFVFLVEGRMLNRFKDLLECW
ncbi:MAG: triphosphoribosyl-dephospho-CoA synthase [Syntrophobacteraceae bacterium]|jgi:triphosphoribosyl-dephospho-CoA synthase